MAFEMTITISRHEGPPPYVKVVLKGPDTLNEHLLDLADWDSKSIESKRRFIRLALGAFLSNPVESWHELSGMSHDETMVKHGARPYISRTTAEKSITPIGKRVPKCWKLGCMFYGIRDERYDAYYCPTCKIWLEPPCDDLQCEFCVNRPPLAPEE